MKTRFTILIIIAFLFKALSADAQQTVDMKMGDLVVKDSTGAVCPPEVWQKLIYTGQYSLRVAPDKKTATLFRLTEEQAALRKQMMASIKPRESTFFKTGEKIASFNERDMNGERFNLKEMQGKVVVVNFWFINCPPCRQEIPELNELVEIFKTNQEVVFIGIALDEKYELADFLKQTPFNYHIVANGRFTAQKYGINSYPTHLVLDKEGKVAFHTTGFGPGTPNAVKTAIETALKGGTTQ